MLIDTHCHIHDVDYPINSELAYDNAKNAGVQRMVCVGTDEENSKLAVEFANEHDGVYVAVGIHPHESKNGLDELEDIILDNIDDEKLIAIGEIGLDYHYDHSPRDVQKNIMRSQIKLAQKYNLPIIFHVREAYDDFWEILDEFSGVRGVLHSFTDSQTNAEKALRRGLYIGVNGFCTFVKDQALIDMFSELPLEKIILETDAPYLTPRPFRGRVNEPAFVKNIAEFFSDFRHISVDELAEITTTNARNLFEL